MNGVWDTLMVLCKYTFLPFLVWWTIIGSLLILLSELEYRWIDPRRVEFRASIWRLTAALSLLFPLIVWFSPIVTQVSIPALRPVVIQFIRSWQSYPVEMKTIPEGANRQIFDFGFPDGHLTISNPVWTTPKWPSVSRSADLSLSDSWIYFLAFLYLVGFFYFLIVQWRRRRLVRDFVWKTYPCDSEEIAALIQVKAQNYRIRGTIEVRLHDGPISPCAVGGRKIAIVLPRTMVKKWSLDEIEPILEHELCHIRRRDFRYEWAALQLKSLLWFNPFVYWLAFRLEDTREALADAYAVDRCQSPKQYACLLTRLAESIVYYPGIQFVHPFAAPGKKILRRLNRISDLFSQMDQSVVYEGYVLRFVVWLLALFLLGGIHTAAPVIHMYSVIEPHPDTNAKSLTYLDGFSAWLADLEKGYVLSANLHHQYSVINPRTGESLLAMDRTAYIHEWVDGSSYCKDIFGRHVLFPSLIPKQDQKPVWLAHRLVNSVSGCFKVFARNDGSPDSSDFMTNELADPFLQNGDFSNPSWNVSLADSRTRKDDADFSYSLTNCIDDLKNVIQMAESGERVAAFITDIGSEKIVITPAFGVGYRFIITVVPSSQPFPSRIETWDEDRLIDGKEMAFSPEGKLLSLVHTRNQFWRESSTNRYEYTIDRLDLSPSADSTIFAPPIPTSDKSSSIIFPAEEAEYFLHSPRAFDRESWTLADSPDFGMEALAQGYFTVKDYKDFYPIEGSRKTYHGGTYIANSIYAPYERIGKITFQRNANEIQGEREIEWTVLSVDFDESGKMTTNPAYRKTINRSLFGIDRLGIEPREIQVDRTRAAISEEAESPISYEEYEKNSNQVIQKLGFLLETDPHRFQTSVCSEGRLGESPRADLYLYNFSETDIRFELAKSDSLVAVELPKNGRLTARSRTAIRFQAPAGVGIRQYRITLQLDHPVVKLLDVDYYIWPSKDHPE